MPNARLIASAAVVSIALAGCMPPRLKVQPSEAILAARAHRDVAPPVACPNTDVSAISPVLATFPFEEPKLTEEGRTALEGVLPWLACHAATPVVIKPAADNHGTDQEQAALARQRGEAVSAYLTAHGIAPQRLRLLGKDEAEPTAPPHLTVLAEGRRW